MQPWRSKVFARKWLVAQLEDMDIPQFSVHDNLQKVLLLSGGYAIQIFFVELAVTIVDEKVIPKITDVAGAGGTVHRLTDEEVGQTILKDMNYKKFKEDKACTVGDLGVTTAVLKRALALQGDISSDGPSKKQKIIGVEVLRRSQKVAAYKLKESKAKSESEDENKHETAATA